jgi:hypothetical protein
MTVEFIHVCLRRRELTMEQFKEGTAPPFGGGRLPSDHLSFSKLSACPSQNAGSERSQQTRATGE